MTGPGSGITIRGVTKRFDLDGRELTASGRHRPQRPGGQFRRAHRPIGMWEIHASAPHRRCLRPVRRRHRRGRTPAAGGAPEPRDRFRLPGRDAAAVAHGSRKRRAAHRDCGRDAQTQPRGADPAGRARRVRGCQARATVWRHAAARRHRARAGAGTQGPSHGRTLRRARRDHAPAHERGASAHLARKRYHRDPRHAHHLGGRLHGRPGAYPVGQSRAGGGCRGRRLAPPPQDRPDEDRRVSTRWRMPCGRSCSTTRPRPRQCRSAPMADRFGAWLSAVWPPATALAGTVLLLEIAVAMGWTPITIPAPSAVAMEFADSGADLVYHIVPSIASRRSPVSPYRRRSRRRLRASARRGGGRPVR
jgi:hypothetical protein